MVKTILIFVFVISITMLVSILILYFFALRNFFSFMNEERMKFHAEMEINLKEIASNLEEANDLDFDVITQGDDKDEKTR